MRLPIVGLKPRDLSRLLGHSTVRVIQDYISADGDLFEFYRATEYGAGARRSPAAQGAEASPFAALSVLRHSTALF